MRYFVGFVSPGSAETDDECSKRIEQSFDRQLCPKYLCQKLLKSDNTISSYSRKCPGCFFRTRCISPQHP